MSLRKTLSNMAMGLRLAVRSPQSIWASFPSGWNVVSAGGGDMGGNFQTLSREFYEANPLVYACVNEVATSRKSVV